MYTTSILFLTLSVFIILLTLVFILLPQPSYGLKIAGSDIPLETFSYASTRRILHGAADPPPPPETLMILRTKDRPDRVIAVLGTGTYLVSPTTFAERRKNVTGFDPPPFGGRRLLGAQNHSDPHIPPGQEKKSRIPTASPTGSGTRVPTTGGSAAPTSSPTAQRIPPGQEKKQNRTDSPSTGRPTSGPKIPPGQEQKGLEDDWLAAIGKRHGGGGGGVNASAPHGPRVTNSFVDGKAASNSAHAEGWEEDSYAEFIPEYKYDLSVQNLTSFVVKTYMGRTDFNHTGCTSEFAGYGRFYMNCTDAIQTFRNDTIVEEIASRLDVLWISDLPRVEFHQMRISNTNYSYSSPGPGNADVLSSGSGTDIRQIIFGESSSVLFGDGTGTVAIFSDSSIDPNHCSLRDPAGTVVFDTIDMNAHSKIVGIYNADDAGPSYSAGKTSHGMLTTSTALGFSCVGVAGVAPKAKLAHIDLSPPGEESIILPSNFFSMITYIHQTAGALVHSASWKIVGFNGAYTDYCYTNDMNSYENPNLLHNYAIGNDGPYDVGAVPASSKNPTSTGATLFDSDYQAYFSSTGPMDDGRRKPDVMAPGMNVFAAQSIPNSTPGYATYVYASGSSLSTPGITATSLVLEQGYKQRNHGSIPSAALRIATMLAHATPPKYVALDSSGASTLVGIPITTWGTPKFTLPGMIDALNAVPIPLSTDPTAARLVRCYQVSGLSAPSTFDFAAVWTDVPGYPLTSPEIVNDVDIVLATDIEGVISQDGVDTREVIYGVRAQQYIRFIAYVYGNVVTEGPVNLSLHIRSPPAASLVEIPCAGTCLPGDQMDCGGGLSYRLCQANGSYTTACYSRSPAAAPTAPPSSSPLVNQTACFPPNAHAGYIYTYANGTSSACLADYCVSGYYMTQAGDCVCVPGSYGPCAAAGSYAICQADTGQYSTCSSRAADDFKSSIQGSGRDIRWGFGYKLAFTLLMIMLMLG